MLFVSIITIGRINAVNILHDRRKITAATSIRLGNFFGVSDRYFLGMQDDIDIRNIKMQIREEVREGMCQVCCIFLLVHLIRVV